MLKSVLPVFVLLLFLPLSAIAQPDDRINPHLTETTWSAHWIMHPAASNTDFGVFHFRRQLDLSEVPSEFIIHTSGDTRYRLFVNGESVAKGPAVGDNHNWRFETTDISSYLKEGENVIAATVWNFGEYNAIQHHSYRTAFILQGNSESEEALNTISGWRVFQNKGYAPIPVYYQTVDGFYAAPHGEHYKTEFTPDGWKEIGFDDSEWPEARQYEIGQPRGTSPFGNLYGWNLVPRTIPMMEEREERIEAVRRTSGIEANDSFLKGTGSLDIPANSSVSLLLDQSYITNAYPVLKVSGGNGATIKLTYAESLRYEDNTKGNRNEIEGKHILGFHDLFELDGEGRTLRTLWLRSYRYIKLEIETADEPLTLHEIYGYFTGYPFEENAIFESSDNSLTDIWEAGWRTARLNAFESYWDCAYYEQLQYVGDTRIQALISLYVSGDDRLMRNSINHFHDSRMAEGITMSRFPSSDPQYIPPYAQLWIPMVHDYWMHRKDDEFVKQFLPGIHSIIRWYEEYLDDEMDILGPMPWWNYVDATSMFERGTPPGSDTGNSLVITLQYLYVLEYALELAEAFDRTHDAAYYSELIERLQVSIPKYGWSDELQMMADTPDHDRFSQHANIYAILTGLVPDGDKEGLMRRIMDNDELAYATYYFRFYLFRAMREAGMGNEYLDQLGPWYDALALGMTTFPEHPEPSRSDAHAWSSSPNYDFFATVAGIRPGTPGFETVMIEPKPGDLEYIRATVPHTKGNIIVDLVFDDHNVNGSITLPEGVTGVFIWNDEEHSLISGKQSL